jgi:hypothetical protein
MKPKQRKSTGLGLPTDLQYRVTNKTLRNEISLPICLLIQSGPSLITNQARLVT